MYPELLPALACPGHPDTPLALQRGARAVRGELLSGALRCPACGARYPIVDGVPDLLGLTLPSSPAQLVNALPIAAWAYERTWRPRSLSLLAGEPFGYDRELPLVTGLAGAADGGLIVDVACSNGLYARAVERARAGAPGHTVGVDHSMPMLQQARAFARREGLRISYVRASAQALPLLPGSAAAALMGGSLNEIGDADGALRELRRALAPRGRAVLMSLVRATTLPGRALQAFLGTGGIAFPPLAALNRSFAAAGLRLRAQWQYGVVLFTLLAPAPAAALAPRDPAP